MTDTPLVAGQAYGLRTWRIVAHDGAELLAGPYEGARWPGSAQWLSAACDARDHAAPAAGCQCGIHAWHPRPESARRVLSTRWLVPGIAEARGAVEVHHDGFRAQEARPHVLFVAPGRNAGQIRRLAEAYGAAVIDVGGAQEIVAYCRKHGLGFSESVVENLLGPGEVARERVARRRRRRGAAARVAGALSAAALLCLGGLALTGEEPSGKVLKGRAGEIRIP